MIIAAAIVALAVAAAVALWLEIPDLTEND